MTPDIEALRKWSAELLEWRLNKFADDPEEAYVDKHGNFQCWKPQLTNTLKPDDPTTGQIWMCVERMRELGWDFRLALMQGAAAYAEFSHYPDWDSAHYARDKEPCVAALLAMRAALEGGE